VHPKIVSEMLGHSSVSITLDVYSHVIPGLGDATAKAMEDALGD
jgi:integrase